MNGNILQENTTSNVFYGLSPYMEYRLTLLCVNDNWKVYKSSEVTEWTEESGMIIPLPNAVMSLAALPAKAKNLTYS